MDFIAGTGDGLKAQYFNGTSSSYGLQAQPLTGTDYGYELQSVSNNSLALSRVDPTINFKWGAGSPNPSVNSDNFSAEWTGQVLAPETGTYTFSTKSDDGIAVWVNGQQLIKDWNNHAARQDSGTIALQSGQKYDIKVDYYEHTGNAVAQLYWSAPSQSQQIIPQSYLYSSPTSSAPAASSKPAFTQAQITSAIAFQYQGENGIDPVNSNANSIGYPSGVPSSYSWKYYTSGVSDILGASAGRGPQQAGAAYDQVYSANTGSGRLSVPNARIELSTLYVEYFSVSQHKWITASSGQQTSGAAFAEDFVNNQATGADVRTESDGNLSVRSGIGNALGDAGSSTGRTVSDGGVGYNYHGFVNRFNINFSDAAAILVAQGMRSIPNQGTDLTDANKPGYIANVGLDSWATTSSPFDNFQTHGGVSGGRFVPIKTDWTPVVDYIGSKPGFNGVTTPTVPVF